MPRNTLPSIHQRLASAVLLIALAWGLAVSLVVWLAVRHEVNELLDDSLRASSEVLRGLLEPNGDSLAARGPAALRDTRASRGS
jgi:sensor domain CHASE-containing protein